MFTKTNSSFKSDSRFSSLQDHGQERLTLAYAGDSFALQIYYQIIAVCIVSILVGGAFPQLQMLLLDGFVPISGAAFKAVLAVSFSAVFFISGGRYRESLALSLAPLFLAELTIQAILGVSTSGFVLRDILLGDFSLYLLPLLSVFAYTVNLRLREKYLVAPLVILGATSLAIAMLQFITGNAILPLSSADGNFSVLSAYIFGRLRAFGLFATSMQFGLFGCFMGSVGWLLLVKRKRRVLGIGVFLGGAVEAAICLTRASQLCFLVVAVLTILLCTRSASRWIRYFPLLSLVAALLVIVYGVAHAFGGNTQDITSTESFSIRLVEWRYFWDYFIRLPLAQQIFGAGLVQHIGGAERIRNVSNASSFFMDNDLLVILMNAGLVGTGLMVGTYLSLWNMLWTKIKAASSLLHLSALVMFAALLFPGFYSNNIPEISLFAMIAFATQD